MALTINTNIMALNTQNQLNKSSSMMQTAMERLSSGLRINSAKDDAAGLAIADRFNTQIRGLNQAVRNANDGISLAQTAEGAMGEMTNILQRMRELAVQSINDTNTASDRLALQNEVDQLYSELDRIAGTTQFNGQNILDGTLRSTTFQVGANAGQTLDVSLESVTTQKLGLNGFSALGELNTGRVNSAGLDFTNGGDNFEIAAGDILINGESAFAATFDNGEANTNLAAGLEAAIDANSAVTGVSAEAYNTVSSLALADDGTVYSAAINSVDVQAGSAEEFVDLVNRDVAGVTAVLNSDNSITISNDTGNDITLANNSATSTNNLGIQNGTYAGYLSLTSTDGSAITVAANTDASGTIADVQALGLNASNGSGELTGAVVSDNALTEAMDIEINGVQIGATDGISAADKAAAINAVESETGVEATAYNEVTVDLDITAIVTGDVITINGTEISLTGDESTEDVVASIAASSLNGVTATSNVDGQLILQSEAGLDITVGGSQNVIDAVTDIQGTSITLSTTGETTGVYTMSLGYSVPAYASTFTIDGANEITVAAGATASTVAALIDAVSGYSASASDSGQIVVSKDDGTDFSLEFTGGRSDPLNLSTPAVTALGAIDNTNTADNDTLDITIDGTEYSFALEGGANAYDLSTSEIVGLINADSNITSAGVFAQLNAGDIELVNNNPTAVVTVDITGTTTFVNVPAAATDATVTAATATAGTGTASVSTIFEADSAAKGRLSLSSNEGADILVAGSDVDELGLVTQGGSTDVVGSGLDITNAANATVALGRIDDALTTINEARSALGAVQNRFESTISNLSNVSQNLTAARGRIIDADFASETTMLSKAQILQQAGTAMLAQANASQQSVLSLLG